MKILTSYTSQQVNQHSKLIYVNAELAAL